MANFTYIADTSQLNKELNKILEIVIDNVSNTLLKDFQRHLDATIYAATPGTKYKRFREKGGFYSGWEITKEQRAVIGEYVKSLIFNGQNLVSPVNENFYAHGGAMGNDERNEMASILNSYISNEEHSMNFGARYWTDGGYTKEGYWDLYLSDLDIKMRKWLDDEFKKFGIGRR